MRRELGPAIRSGGGGNSLGAYTVATMTTRVFLLALLVAAAASAQTPDRRLTTADVEQATGLKPVHLVAPGSIPGAGPGLNFATADNKMLVMVNFGPDTLYTRAKNQKEMEVAGKKYPMELHHADLPGIGDEAFDSPPGPMQYVIYLRKGKNAASINTFLQAGKPRLSMDQLKAIAKIVAGRI